MLKKKGNRVLVNYLAGGQDQQIASEQQANAESNGLLHVAARNAMDVPEQPAVEQQHQIEEETEGTATAALVMRMEGDDMVVERNGQAEMRVSTGVIGTIGELAEHARAIAPLHDSLRKAREEYIKMMDARMEKTRQEHAQKMGHMDEEHGKKMAQLHDACDNEIKAESRKRRYNTDQMISDVIIEVAVKEYREGALTLDGLRERRRMTLDDAFLESRSDGNVGTSNEQQQLQQLPSPPPPAEKLVYDESQEVGMNDMQIRNRRRKFRLLEGMCEHGVDFRDKVDAALWTGAVLISEAEYAFAAELDERIARCLALLCSAILPVPAANYILHL